MIDSYVIEDTSRDTLIDRMLEWPVAGLISDEAGMLKPLLRHAHTIAKMLDGLSMKHSRMKTKTRVVSNPRLVMLLMEQPELFKDTKVLLGAKKGGVGVINRCFTASIPLTPSDDTYDRVKLSAEVATLQEKRVVELLDISIQHVKDKIPKRPMIKLSDEALPHFKELSLFARQKCAPDSEWFYISEYIARHAERVLRLAGMFHVYEFGASGEISLDTLKRAEGLAKWYIRSFAHLVYEPPKQTQAEIDAGELLACFYQFFHQTGQSQFPISGLNHTALSIGLTPTRVTRALAKLGEQGRIRVFIHFKKPWIDLNVFRLAQY
jgi:hypothetical protein